MVHFSTGLDTLRFAREEQRPTRLSDPFSDGIDRRTVTGGRRGAGDRRLNRRTSIERLRERWARSGYCSSIRLAEKPQVVGCTTSEQPEIGAELRRRPRHASLTPSVSHMVLSLGIHPTTTDQSSILPALAHHVGSRETSTLCTPSAARPCQTTDQFELA